MRVVHERCCGLDVHKMSVVACVITGESQETRSFGTRTRQLVELSAWLRKREVTHVAMESTGVYWKPICNLLEDEFTVWVVNAHHIKTVPGRKIDVRDAEWIAELLMHGLLRPSFIPERAQRELRELVRYRQSLVQERSREANRIQKVLEGANIKLGSVATDVLGVSGRMMLTALAEGEEDPRVLAEARTRASEAPSRRAMPRFSRLWWKLPGRLPDLDLLGSPIPPPRTTHRRQANRAAMAVAHSIALRGPGSQLLRGARQDRHRPQGCAPTRNGWGTKSSSRMHEPSISYQ